jgi:hypothetical protein
MKNKPLIQHIFSLNEIETKAFQLWLASPLHNSRLILIDLYHWILPFRNENMDLDLMTKENAAKVIYPNQPYDEKQIRYEMSFLLKQLRQFLAWQVFNKKENLQQQFLLSDLSERGLEKPFERQTKIAFKNLEKQPFRNEAYYLENYQIQLEQYDFLSENNRTENLPLRDLTENFTIYSITNLLKWHCNILTHKSISKADYNTDFLQYILIHLKKGNYAEIPTIQIYYQIYQALDTGKIEHYQLLKSLLLKSFNQFPIVEIRNILLLTINICIRKLNAGEQPFLREAFNWYKQGFETKTLLKNKEISRYIYNNVVIIAMKIQEFEWTKSFLEAYKNCIPELYRHDTYYFNLALWYEYQKQYDEVLNLLQKVTFNDVLQTLHSKIILLRIYYELDSEKALESLLDSIRIYLYRHKKLGYHKATYSKVIQYTKKLIQLNPFDKVAKERFRVAIESENGLLLKSWFLEKVAAKN